MTAPTIISAAEALALIEAATPGPWHVGRSALCDCLRQCANVYADQGEDVTRPCRSEVSDGDAPLLAAAPDLAATVVALHAEVERAASAERGRIVAWLRAWADAYEPKYSVYPDDCRDLADRIERGEVTP